MDLLQAWSSLGHKSNPRTDQWALAACMVVVKHNVKKLQEFSMLLFFNLRCYNMQTYISINNNSQLNFRVYLYDSLWLKLDFFTLFSKKDNMAELCLEPHLLTDVSQLAFGNSLKHPLKRQLKLQGRIKPQKTPPKKTKQTKEHYFLWSPLKRFPLICSFHWLLCEPKGPQISSPHRDVDQ